MITLEFYCCFQIDANIFPTQFRLRFIFMYDVSSVSTFAKELLYLSSAMILSPGTWEASKRICIEKSN